MEDWLKDIIASDDLGLLKTKPKSQAPTADDHLLTKFKQINDFYDKNGYEPKANRGNPIELMRSKSLESIRKNEQHCRALELHDIHSLLPRFEEVAPESIGDILADDALGILGQTEDSIFTLKHVKKSPEMPSTIARRQKCLDYHLFEPVFNECQRALDNKTKISLLFSGEQDIETGMMFIFRGFLAYVADMEQKKQVKGKTNARLRLIFSNGTESNMLLRSFARELYRNNLGRRVVDIDDEKAKEQSIVSEKDAKSGYIYILKSLSNETGIRELTNLYKIGYSTIPVVKRIANAKNEPTYLMAPVKIVAEFECYNMRANKFEGLLHTFFGNSCLDVKVADSNGIAHKPREWFIAPLEAIKQAAQMMVTGDIVHYRFDSITQAILERT